MTHKSDFAVFRNNRDLTYFDYAATTFMPDSVLESWVEYNENVGVSVHRGNGVLSGRALKIYEESKTAILRFFHAEYRYDTAFGKNATECLNLLAYSLRDSIGPGDIILLSPYEHHSNFLPWERIAVERNACLLQLPLLADGEIDYGFIDRIDTQRIRVFSVSLISNVNGHVFQIEKLKHIMERLDAFTIVDISQAAGHTPLDFASIGADAFVMSAHKMYGPKNIGAAIIKKSRIEALQPFLFGGGMVWNSLGEKPEWMPGAGKFEAGTVDVSLVYAWRRSCEYLEFLRMDQISRDEEAIHEVIADGLSSIKRVHIIPGSENGGAICSFDIDGIHPHDFSSAMSKYGIELRTGHMCAQGTLANLGINGINRVSWGIGTGKEDVDKLISSIEKVVYGLY